MDGFSVSAGFGADIGADGKPVRLGLMGGTFDPLHVGHIACAQAACKACNIEKVLFIPAANPNFKQGKQLAQPCDRVSMCEAALRGFPQFGVCDIEVRRGGVTYSVDTLRQLRDAYPKNVELCFIMGADSLATLPRWHESFALAQLAAFVAVSRPGQVVDAELLGRLRQLGFRVEYIDGPQVDVSSTEIRRRVAAGESVEGMVPRAILHAVEAEPAYRVEGKLEEKKGVGAVAEALSGEFFEARKRELSGRVSEKRFAHVMGVVDACERLAVLYGVDVSKARLAGLLHDWDKGYDDAGIRARVDRLGLREKIDSWVVENMPQVLHGHTAACALSQEFPQIPVDVIQAIDRHTVAHAHMSKLDMVLYIADAIEEGRRFGRIDELRASVGLVELEELFFLTYEYWVFLLFERRRQLHPDTIAIWNSLVARRAAGKEKNDR